MFDPRPSSPATGLRYDVCVVGAGPAGSTAASLLARQGRSVALVDRARFPRDKTCGDGITPRGTRVLARIGALDAVREAGYACRGVDIRGQGLDAMVDFTMRFDRGRDDEPCDLIVVPRLAFDDLLLRRALADGLDYFEDTKVVDVVTSCEGARVMTDDGRAIDASLVVVATGAESQLLRATGLLSEKPPLEHAARAYFDGVEGLTDRVVLFFDEVDLPGYGWIFPTSPSSANIGCGVFAQHDRPVAAARAMPQAKRLERLIATHPLLSRMLANATRIGPLRAYPLRTDFRATFAGRARLLVVGEAAGLVNPITGEGIDYALESAEFVAQAVTSCWRDAGALDADGATRLIDHYRRHLARRFATRFRLYHAIQRHALAPSRFPAVLTQIARAPQMQRLLVESLFGRTRPLQLLKPSVLMNAARLLTARRS